MRNRSIQSVFLSVLFVLSLGGPVFAAAPPSAGKITALLPVARIIRGAGKQAATIDAVRGQDLVWDDLVRTEKGGRARITLNDQSILSLGSQAELRIVKNDAKSQQTALQLSYGRLRAEVTTVTRQGGSFEVKTPTAVAGVIGTDFGTTTGIGQSDFICISGTVNVSNSNPAVPGTVPCTPGTTTTVATGLAPTTPKPATPQQIQELIQDTEPAVIGSLSPTSALPGMTIDAAVTGSKLAAINKVSVSGSGVTASLSGTPTDTGATVHMVVSPSAAPGPRTLTLAKPSGASAAAMFTILAPPGSATDVTQARKSYLDTFDQERQAAINGLNALGVGVQQAADLASQTAGEANSKLAKPLDLTDFSTALKTETGGTIKSLVDAGTLVNTAAGAASTSFATTFDLALKDLQARTSGSVPDAIFTAALKAAFDKINGGLLEQFAATNKDLGGTASAHSTAIANDSIAVLEQIAAAAAKQGVNANISLPGADKSLEQGFDASFSAGSAASALGISVSSYRWVLCDPSYKPSVFGVPLPAGTPPCTALPGYGSTSSDFAFPTCALAPNDYVARLTVLDANNNPISVDIRLRVNAPAYDNPTDTLYKLAAAYSALQSSQFLNFFSSDFSGLTNLQENIRKTFPQLSSMQINLKVSQSTVNCNDATVRADWDQKYTFATDNSCAATPPGGVCNRTVFNQTEQLTARMVRIPGKGWYINDFQGDNGTVQGVPAGPITTDSAIADLTISGLHQVSAGSRRGTTGAVAAGVATYQATITNIGSADLTVSPDVVFTLLDADGATVATDTEKAGIPLAKNGGSETVNGTITNPGTGVKLTAAVNPDCKVPEKSCDGANVTALGISASAPVVDLGLSNFVVSGSLTTGVAASASVDVSNIGNTASTATSQNLLIEDRSSGTTVLGKADIPAIAAGGKVTIMVTFTPIGSGSKTLFAEINPSLASDPTPADNTISITVTVNPPPPVVDLGLSNFVVSGTLTTGVAASASVDVSNSGNTASTATSQNLLIEDRSSGTTVLGKADIPAIPAGGKVTVTATFTPIGSGSKTLFAEINPSLAGDPTPADNTISITVTVNPAAAAAYTITSILFIPGPNPATGANALQVGENGVSVDVTVANTGSASPTGSITVSASCTPTSVCGTPATTTIAAPAAGTSTHAIVTFSGTFTLPPATYTGTVTLSTSIPQSSTAGNTATAPFESFDFNLVGVGTFATQNILIGSTRSFNVKLDETGDVTKLSIPITVGPSDPNASYSFTSPQAADSTNAYTVVVSSSHPSGPATIAVTGTRRGVSKSYNQNVQYYTAQLQDVSQPGNSASNPLTLIIGDPATNVTFNLSGTFAGTGTVTVSPPANFTVSPASVSPATGANFNIAVQANSGATPNVVQSINLQATIPNTRTPDTLNNVLFVLPKTSSSTLPNYTITSAVFTGYPDPATGANALQFSNTITQTLDVIVTNNGGASPTGAITLTAMCSPNPPCGGGSPKTTTIAAPGQGTSVQGTITLGTVNMAPGAYTGTVTLTTSITQSSTSDDSLSVPFEIFDFNLVATTFFGTNFATQNVLVGAINSLTFALDETGDLTKLSIPIAPVADPNITFGFTSPIPEGPVLINATVSASHLLGAGSLAVTGARRGETRTFSQNVNFYTAAWQNITYPGNSPSNPLIVPINASHSTTVDVKLVGNYLGNAPETVTPVSGFTFFLEDGSVTANELETLSIDAGSGATPGTVVRIDLTATIPDTSPTQKVTLSLYVLPQNAPDLAVLSAPVPSRTISSSFPLLSGEPLDYAVTVTNNGSAASTAGTLVGIFFGFGGSSQQQPLPSIPAGGSATVTIHVAASDPLPNSSAGIIIQVKVDPDPLGDLNPSNDIFNYVVSTSDWGFSTCSGPGSSNSTPLLVAAGSSSNTVSLCLAVASGGGIATPVTLVNGTVSSRIAHPTLSASTAVLPGTPPTETFGVDPTAASPGQYFVGAIAEFTDGGSPTAQRQATVFIGVTAFTPADTVTVTPTPNNTTSANALQLNGTLVEQETLVATRAGCGTGPCPGSVDLHFTDGTSPAVIFSSPQQIKALAFGSASAGAIFQALTDSSGNVTTGLQTTIISATSVQTSSANGGPPPLPIVGTLQTTLYFNVGDIFISIPSSSCDLIKPNGGTLTLPITYVTVGGYNVPSISFQFTNLPAGVTVDLPNGTSPFNGSSYGTDTFTFTNTNSGPSGSGDIIFSITAQNSFSSDTKFFDIPVQLAAACSGVRGGGMIRGTRTRPGGGSLNNLAARSAAGALPDLQISSSDISFTPSIPKAGDPLQLRFRVTNAGDGDAAQVPIALQVAGRTVAEDKFDVRAHSSTLAGLEWAHVQPPAPLDNMAVRGRSADEKTASRNGLQGNGSLDAVVAIDPANTVKQKTAIGKTARIVRLNVQDGGVGAIAGRNVSAPQREIMEIQEGACEGFSFASGATSNCDTADLAISVEQLADGNYQLASDQGVADAGPTLLSAAGTPSASALQFGHQAKGVAGHTYAVQLKDGKTGWLTVQAILSYGQLDAKTQKLFGHGGAHKVVRSLGGDSGPQEAGDVAAGARKPAVYFDVIYQESQ